MNQFQIRRIIYIYILLNALKYSYYYHIENFMIYGKNQIFFPKNRLKNENTKFRKYRGYTVIPSFRDLSFLVFRRPRLEKARKPISKLLRLLMLTNLRKPLYCMLLGMEG